MAAAGFHRVRSRPWPCAGTGGKLGARCAPGGATDARDAAGSSNARNDVLTAELVAARLRKVLRCKQGALSKAMVCWQREQLQWLLHSAQPPLERCGVMADWHSPHLSSRIVRGA